MAERRMFSKTIIDSDAFLDMPASTQALYFHLSMRADDDGFINAPRKIQRMVGASEDDLKLLIAKRFIIPFDSGIVVIKHWKIHNYIQKDRYHPTVYQDEMALLEVKENNAYSLADTSDTVCIQAVSSADTQVRIDKDSVELSQDRIGECIEPPAAASPTSHSKKETASELFNRLLPEYSFSEEPRGKLVEWMQYKSERRESYKETGLKSLLRQVEKNAKQYGDQAICDLIDLSMSSGWKGIAFDKLKSQGMRNSAPNKSAADNLNDFYAMAARWAEGSE